MSLAIRALLAVASLYAAAASALTPAPDLSLAGAGNGLPTARLFGQSVAASPQYLAVGAPGVSSLGAPGAVWVYTRNGDAYSLLGVLQAPTPAAGDGFGQHVIFVGNSLIVGAPFRTVSGVTARGEVYVYTLVAGQFALAQTLVPGAAVSADDYFGFHLSADAGWLAVGVPRAGLNDEGQVQLYRYDPNFETWIYHSQFSGSTSNIRLGLRVLARGTRVLAAAPEEMTSGLSRGYVYEYLRTGNGANATFAQVQRFRSSVPVADSAQVFGSSMALSADASQLVVGAPFDVETPGDLRGAAFVFARVGGVWVEQQRIASPGGAAAESFGASLILDGNSRLLIGDIRQGFGSSGQVGAVHEFQYLTTPSPSWVEGRSWLRGAGTDQDFYGNAIAAQDGHLIIGSVGHDDGSNVNVGRVYVYSAVFRDGFE